MKMEKLAKVISLLSSPFIVLPIFGIAIISAYSQLTTQFLLWNSTFLILILGVPLAYIWWGVNQGHFTDLHVALREQRFTPYLVATIAAVLLVIAFHFEHTPPALTALAWTLAVNGAVFALITLVWKISLHIAAWVGSTLIVAWLINPQSLWLLLLVPLIVWARLQRQRHNIWQTVGAGVLVAVCTYFTLTIALK